MAETQGYDVAGHVDALARHGVMPDVVVVQAGAYPPCALGPGCRVVEADVARPHGLAHDPDKLAGRPVVAPALTRGMARARADRL